jgi:chromosome segregation ATPase
MQKFIRIYPSRKKKRNQQMNALGRKIIGIFLLLIAAISVAITMYGIVQVWQMKEPLEKNLLSNLELIETTLQNTGDGLIIAHQSLDSVMASLEGLEATLQTLAASIEDTAPLISSLESLTAETLPQTINSTQSSLAAASDSAKIIDSVLRALTIFNRDLYNPAEPLDVALGKVSASMDDLPETLNRMESSLNATNNNLFAIQAEILLTVENIKEINQGLEEAQKVIEAYQTSVDELSASIKGVKTRLPDWMDALVWIISFFLFWLIIVQLGVLAKSWGLVRSDPS